MTPYEKHLQAMIDAKLRGKPRNRAERRKQAGRLRVAARYCERVLRVNPESDVIARMDADLRAVKS